MFISQGSREVLTACPQVAAVPALATRRGKRAGQQLTGLLGYTLERWDFSLPTVHSRKQLMVWSVYFWLGALMMRVTGCSTTLWSMLPPGPAGPAPLSCSPGTRRRSNLWGGSERLQRPGANFLGELGEPIPVLALREPQPRGIAPSSPTAAVGEGRTRHPKRTHPNQAPPPAAPPRPPAAAAA